VTLRLHHLNCASLCPLLGPEVVTHCLLIETPHSGLVLVDAGIGHAVSQTPQLHMSWMNRVTLRPQFVMAESALSQVTALGFAPGDVRHIVLTHLDVDHAGGIQDFPDALVHVHRTEFEAASVLKRRDPRYDPRLWSPKTRFQLHGAAGERWRGFDCVRQLPGIPPELVLVPLHGHTLGHCGVAVQDSGGRWLLHAGDAYLEPVELTNPRHRSWRTGLAARLTSADLRAREMNLERLRVLCENPSVRIEVFCAHSPVELRRLQGAPGGAR